jgi:hypothetical protein
MASKEQIQQALNELWTKYGNTLSALSDSLDKMDQQDAKIAELESQLSAEPEFDLDLSAPAEIAELENKIANR